MKKLAVLSLCILLFLFAVSKRGAKPAKPPKETLVSLLNEEKFFTKLGEPLPQWMEEQLDEDFAPFEKVQKGAVSAAFEKVDDPMLVRYRAVEGELYRFFPEWEAISLEDNTTERALKTMLHYGKIESLDFIYCYSEDFPRKDFEVPVITKGRVPTEMIEEVCHYFLVVFERYASMQELDEEELKGEVRADPRWVNIQQRRKLRREVEKRGLDERYTLSSTPFLTLFLNKLMA